MHGGVICPVDRAIFRLGPSCVPLAPNLNVGPFSAAAPFFIFQVCLTCFLASVVLNTVAVAPCTWNKRVKDSNMYEVSLLLPIYCICFSSLFAFCLWLNLHRILNLLSSDLQLGLFSLFLEGFAFPQDV